MELSRWNLRLPTSPAGPGRPTMNSASEALRWEWSEEITPWIENNGYSYSWYSYIVVYLCGIHPCRSICCKSAFIPESSSRTLQASPQDLEESDRSPSFTRATCGYRGFLDTGKKTWCVSKMACLSPHHQFSTNNILVWPTLVGSLFFKPYPHAIWPHLLGCASEWL